MRPFGRDLIRGGHYGQRSCKPRVALVCWRTLAENPWMEVPMTAAAQHLPPRPKSVPNTPGMFARRSRARHRGSHCGRLGAAALRETRHGPQHCRRPRAGGGCGSVNPNRRREQLVAQPSDRSRLGCCRVSPQGAGALCGWCERAPARCDVVDQQRACLNDAYL